MDSKQPEVLFIQKFIIKDKQKRYLNFLTNPRTRKKFINKLYHFNDFNWRFFREISGSENTVGVILSKLQTMKHVTSCSIISSNADFDGKRMPIQEAIENLVGTEASILIFGDAEIIYFEGEAPFKRYISI